MKMKESDVNELRKLSVDDLTHRFMDNINEQNIKLIEGIAKISEDKCMGCGLCAHHCPQEAIKLERKGLREVLVPIPRIKIDL